MNKSSVSLKQHLAIEVIPENRQSLRRRLREVKKRAYDLYIRQNTDTDYKFEHSRDFFNRIESNVDEMGGEIGHWFHSIENGKHVTSWQPMEVKI